MNTLILILLLILILILSLPDAIIVVGTGSRGLRQAPDQIMTRQLLYHTAYIFGWQRNALINRSCGGTILLNNHRFGRHPNIRRIFHPIPTLRGRVGGLEVGGALRLTLFYLYFPPRVIAAHATAKHHAIVRDIVDWTRSALLDLSGGSIPFSGS